MKEKNNELALFKAELKDRFPIGSKFKVDYGEGNLNNKIIEIRAIIDDEYLVVRSWSRRKQRYNYAIEHWYTLYLSRDITKKCR